MAISHNIVDAARYFAYCLRYPSRIDILQQSFGIARRARDFAPEWELHRSLCRAFVRECLALDRTIESVNIVGAGRLLDIDVKYLPMRVRHIALFDVDPSVAQIWKAFAQYCSALECAVTTHSVDITGIFDSLPKQLELILKKDSIDHISNIKDCISSFQQNLKPLTIPAADLTLSINILSQLPILFRERIIQLLLRYRLISDEAQLPEQIKSTVENLCCEIQKCHIECLMQSSGKMIALISDSEFQYYKPGIEERQIENALYLHPEMLMTEHKLKLHTQWMWHIAPYGRNPEDYGSEHLVDAWAWQREQSANSCD